MSDRNPKDSGTKVTDFLFGEHSDKILSNLDIRTDVPATEMFELLHYYQVLASLGSTAANNLKNHYEALLISVKRQGRVEGTEVLKNKEQPKIRTMYQAVEQVSGNESNETV